MRRYAALRAVEMASRALGETRFSHGRRPGRADAARFSLPLAGTGCELPIFGPQSAPDFLDRRRRAPRRRSPPKPHGAGVAAGGLRVGAWAAALAPRPLPENRRDNFWRLSRT